MIEIIKVKMKFIPNSINNITSAIPLLSYELVCASLKVINNMPTYINEISRLELKPPIIACFGLFRLK